MSLERLRELQPTYEPNERVLKGLGEIGVLGLVGTTASGKTTSTSRLAKDYPELFGYVLNETGRRPRETDLVGVDFIYRSVEEFAEDVEAGEMVQYVISELGDIYGTRLSSYPKGKTGILPMVPKAAKHFRQLPFKSFDAAYVIPDDFDRWYNVQLAKHEKASGWTPEQRSYRMQEAAENVEQALADGQMKFVLNDEVERATERILQIARGEKPDDEDAARAVATQSLERLKELSRQ